jgi:hypothetical protein
MVFSMLLIWPWGLEIVLIFDVGNHKRLSQRSWNWFFIRWRMVSFTVAGMLKRIKSSNLCFRVRDSHIVPWTFFWSINMWRFLFRIRLWEWFKSSYRFGEISWWTN